MRFLFVVPPLVGHVNPTLAVGAELAARGHETAWTGPPEVLTRLLPAHTRLFPSGGAPGDAAGDAAGRTAADATGDTAGGAAVTGPGGYAALHEHWRDLRGVAALHFLWSRALIPLARAMVPGVERAVESYRPDVVVADQQALAGPLVARRLGVPWATSATTSAEFTRPFSGFPKVGAWVTEQIAGLLAEYGAGAGVGAGTSVGSWDPRFSDRLVLVFSTPELISAGEDFADEGGAARSGERFPAHYAFVGPAFGARPGARDFPWRRLDPDRRRVLVSLGTLNREAGARFYACVLDAAEQLKDRVQLVLAAPGALTGPVPDHVLLRDTVPQLELLPHLDAVVSHGGHNTVCEALAHGLPLVVAPIRDDQPIVAQQVAAAGAGVRLRFGRARAQDLCEAITAVVDDPGYRRAARRIQTSFAAAGGAAAAADRLEKLI
ncbi:glycosyltransferase [Streptomyces bambusae]|uniref:Glycosyltransferase n=1 Tax=Streptomyces bambusae TaxID=1550616 RepID=A0ABS6ZCR6_9ACTN|nr:nucleotide disphospho-sugar-binding domain-containing protein [Streptomyces bambusae]MBW5485371.1 glycosyltransferase [Streptomyces bambusae]